MLMERSILLSRALNAKLKMIESYLLAKGSVLVALSGGVDSSVVAALAKRILGDKVVAVTANIASMPLGELNYAKRIARELGIKHRVEYVDILTNSFFTQNLPDRCYYCKKTILQMLKQVSLEEDVRTIVDGTNADDLKNYRPGALALEEEKIESPLAVTNVTKAETYIIAEMLNLSTAHKPSMSCLATRFPYGEEITAKRLRQVADAEVFLKKQLKVKQLRVRHYGELARIEVNREERRCFFDTKLMDRVVNRLQKIGFLYVAMDLKGYRSGSMDEKFGKAIAYKRRLAKKEQS
jgi:uncharacterized protein